MANAFPSGTSAVSAAAVITALVANGAPLDAATNAVASLAWATNGPGGTTPTTFLWGIFVKCTTTYAGGTPVYAYDTAAA